MSPVLNSLTTVALTLASIGHFSKGMAAAGDTATFLKHVIGKEYQRHLCGSAGAASANLRSAALVLTRMYPEETPVWDAVAEGLIGRFTEETEQRAPCSEDMIVLHEQSPDQTPEEFPNVVYRLTWPTMERGYE